MFCVCFVNRLRGVACPHMYSCTSKDSRTPRRSLHTPSSHLSVPILKITPPAPPPSPGPSRPTPRRTLDDRAARRATPPRPAQGPAAPPQAPPPPVARTACNDLSGAPCTECTGSALHWVRGSGPHLRKLRARRELVAPAAPDEVAHGRGRAGRQWRPLAVQGDDGDLQHTCTVSSDLSAVVHCARIECTGDRWAPVVTACSEVASA